MDGSADGARLSADFTVTTQGRLVALIWRRAGQLKRAGKSRQTLERDLPWGHVEVFDGSRAQLLDELASASADLDAFVFKLKLEELEVHDGELQLQPSFRRF